jgi:hypothetical protein
MAIEFGVDQQQRLLLLKGLETLTVDDILAYLREVLARPDVAGFNGLVDLTGAKDIVIGMMGKIQLFGKLSSSFDARWSSSRLAIVTTGDDRFGLDGLYATFKGLKPASAKQVSVFRNMDDALQFLGLDGQVPGEIECQSLLS